MWLAIKTSTDYILLLVFFICLSAIHTDTTWEMPGVTTVPAPPSCIATPIPENPTVHVTPANQPSNGQEISEQKLLPKKCNVRK